MSQSSTDLNIAFVMDNEQAINIVTKLHGILFKGSKETSVFGRTWDELFERKSKVSINRKSWWNEKKDQLFNLMKDDNARYVYDLSVVRGQIEKLKTMKAIDQIFYAMKANNCPEILKLMYESKVGFECVSIEELSKIIELFPEISMNKIIFTPNFSSKSEYERAFEWGVNVTLDNLYPLEQWGSLFKNREVFLRIDPEVGHGHHEFVQTAGSESKFGIPMYQFDKLKVLLDKQKVNVVGLHAHSGSGIRHPYAWRDLANFLMEQIKYFPNVKFLDLGGGLGIPEKSLQEEFNISELDMLLEEVMISNKKIKLWLEPGRYLVAQAGVLLATVTQLKDKSSTSYIGVNTGMNSLIRPALYGSHHEIYNLSKIDLPKDKVVTIVGPICETGDVLGRTRNLPKSTQSGDILLIDTVGAYGRVMSSNYTMRSPAKEEFIYN